MLDRGTQELLEHLSKVENGSEINSRLIENYLLSFNSGATEVDEEYISQVFPLLNDVLLKSDSHAKDMSCVFDVLKAVLSRISFDDILKIYDKEFIVESALSSSPQVAKLALNIIETKLQESWNVFASTNLFHNIIRTYISDVSLPLPVVNSTESLVSKIVKHYPSQASVLISAENIKLFEEARNSNNTTLMARLLDLLLIVLPLINKNNFPLSLLAFHKNEILKIDDTLFVVLLIGFYKRLVSAFDPTKISADVLVPLSNTVAEICEMWTLRTTDSIIGSFYAGGIAGLLSEISLSKTSQIEELCKELREKFQLLKSYNLYLSSSDADLLLLSKFAPTKLGGKEFYEDVLCDLPLFNKMYFSILLNTVGAEEIFSSLVSEERITSAAIQKLPMDLLYVLILQLTRFAYSANYLLRGLPAIVTDYLIRTPSQVNDAEIWGLREKALENLLTSEVIDLSVWKDGLLSEYKIMKNGRDVRNIIPSVDVNDEFL